MTAASLIEIVLDDTSTASSRCLQRRHGDVHDISHYSRDSRHQPVCSDSEQPVNLVSLCSRHVAEQLTYIDAVRSHTQYISRQS